MCAGFLHQTLPHTHVYCTRFTPVNLPTSEIHAMRNLRVNEECVQWLTQCSTQTYPPVLSGLVAEMICSGWSGRVRTGWAGYMHMHAWLACLLGLLVLIAWHDLMHPLQQHWQQLHKELGSAIIGISIFPMGLSVLWGMEITLLSSQPAWLVVVGGGCQGAPPISHQP